MGARGASLYSQGLKYFLIQCGMWPGDAIWRHRSGLRLAQAMACCLMEPSHSYLNQCWLVSSVRSSDNYPRAISRKIPQPSTTKFIFKITYLKLYLHLPGISDLRHWGLVMRILFGELGHHWKKKIPYCLFDVGKNQHTIIFIKEMHLVACKVADILPRSQ